MFRALVFTRFAGSIVSDISRNNSYGISFEGMSSCSFTLFFWETMLILEKHVQAERLRQLFFPNSQEDY